jgi:hypothetical protein
LARLDCRELALSLTKGGCAPIFWGELGQLFPEEFTAVEDAAAAHVKQIYRQHAIFIVITEDIGVIAFGSGDALAFL